MRARIYMHIYVCVFCIWGKDDDMCRPVAAPLLSLYVCVGLFPQKPNKKSGKEKGEREHQRSFLKIRVV